MLCKKCRVFIGFLFNYLIFNYYVDGTSLAKSLLLLTIRRVTSF
jgi:hypothetical protein